MVGLHAALLIVAVILFALSAVPWDWPHTGRLQSVGLAFFAAAFLVP